MGRKRTRLVPEECLERFEVRAVLYLNEGGDEMFDADVDTPGRTGWDGVSLHEVIGLLEVAKDLLREQHAALDG